MHNTFSILRPILLERLLGRREFAFEACDAAWEREKIALVHNYGVELKREFHFSVFNYAKLILASHASLLLHVMYLCA